MCTIILGSSILMCRELLLISSSCDWRKLRTEPSVQSNLFLNTYIFNPAPWHFWGTHKHIVTITCLLQYVLQKRNLNRKFLPELGSTWSTTIPLKSILVHVHVQVIDLKLHSKVVHSAKHSYICWTYSVSNISLYQGTRTASGANFLYICILHIVEETYSIWSEVGSFSSLKLIGMWTVISTLLFCVRVVCLWANDVLVHSSLCSEGIVCYNMWWFSLRTLTL